MGDIYYAVAMAGLGRRFTEAGFSRPKYMLEAAGRTLFEHSVFSLPLELSAKIFFIKINIYILFKWRKDLEETKLTDERK